MRPTQKQIDRFWSKVNIRGEDECWEWKAGKGDDGYGQITFAYKTFKAHRIAFLIAYGHLPSPMGLHSCDNHACVNPKHVHEGTAQNNMDEKVERGRSAKGEHHGRSKLTDALVLEIRNSTGTQRQKSKKYGISQSVVSDIETRRLWKHI